MYLPLLQNWLLDASIRRPDFRPWLPVIDCAEGFPFPRLSSRRGDTLRELMGVPHGIPTRLLHTQAISLPSYSCRFASAILGHFDSLEIASPSSLSEAINVT